MRALGHGWSRSRNNIRRRRNNIRRRRDNIRRRRNSIRRRSRNRDRWRFLDLCLFLGRVRGGPA
jgi:hypothetical protein